MIAAETRPLIDQGAVQFVLFTIMLLVILAALWLSISK